jgi:hypothetical protein
MEKIYRMDLAGPDLSRMFPKNSAKVPASGRRPTSQASFGVPERDRRQS